MTHPWIMCVRRAAIVALLSLALPSIALPGVAHAGQAAARKIIGFSPDGASFAFEQYTQFYGSADIMTTIQVMEAHADGYMNFTWFIHRTWGESKATTDAGRTTNAAKAKPLLDRLGIAEPGTRLAGQPSMDLDTVGVYPVDPPALANRLAVTLPDGRRLHLALSDHPLGEASCKGIGGRDVEGNVTVTGAVLLASIEDAPDVTLLNDKQLPADRRCVTEYGIAEAYLHQAADGTQTLAVLVETVDANESRDGPTRRFIVAMAKLLK